MYLCTCVYCMCKTVKVCKVQGCNKSQGLPSCLLINNSENSMRVLTTHGCTRNMARGI